MMHMSSMARPFTALLAVVLLLAGCTAEPDVTYGLLPLELNASAAEKDRVKSIDQWITILHADLFGEALGSAELFKVKQAFYSVETRRLRAVLVSTSCRTAASTRTRV